MPRPNNRLLAALPQDVFLRILPDLRTVPIATRRILHTEGQPLQDVYFLNGGVASITTLLTSGTMVEAATVGDEGMVGIEAFFVDDPISPGESMIQVPD